MADFRRARFKQRQLSLTIERTVNLRMLAKDCEGKWRNDWMNMNLQPSREQYHCTRGIVVTLIICNTICVPLYNFSGSDASTRIRNNYLSGIYSNSFYWAIFESKIRGKLFVEFDLPNPKLRQTLHINFNNRD